MFMPSYQINPSSFDTDLGPRNIDQRFESATSYDTQSRFNKGATFQSDIARTQLPSNRVLQQQIEPRVATEQFQTQSPTVPFYSRNVFYPGSQRQQGNVQLGLNQQRQEQVNHEKRLAS
jgi:hypothetical protein